MYSVIMSCTPQKNTIKHTKKKKNTGIFRKPFNEGTKLNVPV